VNPIILGTAGHIDHGKTALIKALTGVDTDRLKEEKLRGITIELGFASLTLPDGQRLGIVDVPGHERFVRHMVAGATGMDLVALIIAADEGVMPQTREHLEICQLLRVKQGLVVLTKADLVDDDWLALVEEDVASFLKGTFLEQAPIVRFSAVTGQGQEELLQTLAALARGVPPKTGSGIFRLAVDRVFTIKGFGTVVTGTAISGELHVSDTVMIYPEGLKARVRNLQVHDENVEVTRAGARTAINLQGIEKLGVERGMVVATPDSLLPSLRLDAHLEALPGAPRPLKNRLAVRLHTGTSETHAQMILLDREELPPGERGYVQFRLSAPLAVKPFDRFVIRAFSPAVTLGGGQILHINPPKHKRLQEEVVQQLHRLETTPPDDQLLFYVQEAGPAGISTARLLQLMNLEKGLLTARLGESVKAGQLFVYDPDNQRYVTAATLQGLHQQMEDLLRKFHRDQPLKPGLSKEELRRKLPEEMDARLFNFLLQQAEQRQKLISDRDLVRLASHRIVLAQDQETLVARLEDHYRKSGLTPPSVKEIAELLKVAPPRVQELIRLLISQGRLVKVKEEMYFHREALSALKDKLVAFLKAHKEIGMPQFKELTQISRKYSIPLMEYFDASKVTVRVGELRRLREIS